MSKVSQHKVGNVENASQHNVLSEEQKKKIWKNAKIRFETTEQINEIIRSQPEKNQKNSDLFSLWIENIIDRASPTDWDTQAGKEISEMDCYYIPDINDKTIQKLLENDEKIYEILNWLLCRPQFFWKKRTTGERKITQEWLDRLNYILNMAAKHTLRHIDEASLLRTNPHSDKDNTPGWWDPTSDAINDGDPRLWYNYFRSKLKDFLTSQWSDKDKKNKIYFNIQSKEQFCQLVRALIVDYIPVISGWSQIFPSTYKEDYCASYYDKNDGKLHKGRVIHHAWEHRLKPLSTRIKDWLFLKNISCFADIERCDGYAWRYVHYDQFKGEVMEPFLQIYRPKIIQKDGPKKGKKQGYPTRKVKEIDSHEKNESIDFDINYKRNNTRWTFVLCTKSQNSILDKTRRDVNYSAPTSLKDMIRWSFVMKDHHDVLFILHHFIKYFIQNSEHNFAHDSNNNAWFDPQRGVLRWLQLKDKWILNTEIAQWIKEIQWLPKWHKPKDGKDPYTFTNDELDWAATNFILNSIDESSSKKSSTSTEYIDTKLIVPTLMRPNPLDVEIKFVTEDMYKNNEYGLSRHDIYEIKRNAQWSSRGEHFILAHKLRQEIDLLLERKPDIKAEIEAKLITENRWKDDIGAAEKIYKDITDNLVIIWGKYWENWFEPTIFCDKEIWDHLKHEWFHFSAESFHYSNDEEWE